MKLIKAGVVGGLIIYIWYAISWMALPWHKTTIHQFKVDAAISQAIEANAPTSGIYLLPAMPEKEKTRADANNEAKHEPMVFAAVSLEGMPATMTRTLMISLITHIVAAFLVAWLLLQTAQLSYIGRLSFILVFALAAGIVTNVPLWNWFKFDSQYILVNFGDLLISWFLAGLVMAKICINRPKK